MKNSWNNPEVVNLAAQSTKDSKCKPPVKPDHS